MMVKKIYDIDKKYGHESKRYPIVDLVLGSSLTNQSLHNWISIARVLHTLFSGQFLLSGRTNNSRISKDIISLASGRESVTLRSINYLVVH